MHSTGVADTFDFDGVPLWYDRHPSQAEGDDI